MCTVLLPPGDNPNAVEKYININQLPTSWWDLLSNSGLYPSVEANQFITAII
jgi:hypothetical protein